ncbi:uncharacterized protein B0H18DRAFT_1215473 [Fomitopsis serialis]|uniref:uncharacterized protein n=1 Tax=Fomitopsis serialis TaxID=139415 RepID=UPI0020079359|nr:uncharacterized protein B0H18DRAFT_1215473 [Neoantrodia serialis]KAH9915524.1 hypothetical protein B0H18DRAFT_1215473 [Neoantrodia serialis]
MSQSAKRYVSGPICAKDWSRFERYAPFVRVLEYSRGQWSIDPTVFLFLQRHARDMPLFPNVRELIWEHATPELVSVISPSIRTLRLPEDIHEDENGHQVHEYAYRTRRHALKQLLPTILQDLPDLKELELRLLGHEAFWNALKSGPSNSFLCQGIRTLDITETPRALASAALPIISTIKGLFELRISVAIPNVDEDDYHPQSASNCEMPSVPPFANLRLLRLSGPLIGVRNLVNAIVAPELEDVELVCEGDLDNDIDLDDDTDSLGNDMRRETSDVLYVIFDLLRRRNAVSLRRLHFTHLDADEPLLLDPVTTDAQVSGPGSPLLGLHRLQDVMILQALPEASQYSNSDIIGLIDAWPELQMLVLPQIVVFPETLRCIARACPEVESLTVGQLSRDFVESLPLSTSEASSGIGTAESSSGRPALRAFYVKDYSEPRTPPGSADSPASSIRSFPSSRLNTFWCRACVYRPPVGNEGHPCRSGEIEGTATHAAKCKANRFGVYYRPPPRSARASLVPRTV